MNKPVFHRFKRLYVGERGKCICLGKEAAVKTYTQLRVKGIRNTNTYRVPRICVLRRILYVFPKELVGFILTCSCTRSKFTSPSIINSWLISPSLRFLYRLLSPLSSRFLPPIFCHRLMLTFSSLLPLHPSHCCPEASGQELGRQYKRSWRGDHSLLSTRVCLTTCFVLQKITSYSCRSFGIHKETSAIVLVDQWRVWMFHWLLTTSKKTR